MPELTLWIGDDLAESPVQLENLLDRGGLTDSRADERVPEPNPVVSDPDQVRVNSGLKGLDAGSAGPRDLVQGRSAVERCRQEGCSRGLGKLAKPVCECPIKPSRQRRGRGRKLLARSPHTARQLNERQRVARRFCQNSRAHDRVQLRRLAI